MMENLTFKVCEYDDVQGVIDFCNLNGFTPRTAEDWVGGNIQAGLVWNKNQLIGAAPFFKRRINIRNNSIIECGHFTAVAIDENWRNKGLGSALLKYVINNFGLDGIFVNSSESDLAYNWYRKNGFEKLSDISFYKLTCKKSSIRKSNMTIQKLDVNLLSNQLTEKLYNTFSNFNSFYGGFEIRDIEFWKKKINYHYYRLYNEYYLISNLSKSSSEYVIATINSYPGREKSIDVLEFACDDENILDSLLNALEKMGLDFKIKKIRFPINKPSSVAKIFENIGLLEEDGFSILYYPITNSKKLNFPYRYFHFDYA